MGMKVLIKGISALTCLGALFAFMLLRAPVPARPATPAHPARSDATQPLAGLTVCVDAGHGGYDGGARARDSGIWEKEINLQVAARLAALLEDSGAAVVMTRTEDVSLDSGGDNTKTRKRQDMERRIAIAREAGADVLLSIHMNEFRSRRESGPQVFYRKGQDHSRLLAGALQEALIEQLKPAKERVASAAGEYFILSLDIPSVLVECGFISNAAEEKLLLDAAYQQRLAQAICDGLRVWRTLAPAPEE